MYATEHSLLNIFNYPSNNNFFIVFCSVLFKKIHSLLWFRLLGDKMYFYVSIDVISILAVSFSQLTATSTFSIHMNWLCEGLKNHYFSLPPFHLLVTTLVRKHFSSTFIPRLWFHVYIIFRRTIHPRVLRNHRFIFYVALHWLQTHTQVFQSGAFVFMTSWLVS